MSASKDYNLYIALKEELYLLDIKIKQEQTTELDVVKQYLTERINKI